MADRTTTAAVHPTTAVHTTAKEVTTGTARATTSQSARSRTTARSITVTTTSTAATQTPTAAAKEAGGLPVAVMGAIGAGVLLLLALVGVLCYKRRKRTAVGTVEASSKGEKGGAPVITNAPRSTHNAISGPMALAPEGGIPAMPAHRPEAQFREQQQFRPGMRDELFAQPGSALHKNLSKQDNNNNNSGNNSPPGPSKGGYGGNSPPRPPPPFQELPPSSSYDDNLVSDYYGGADHKAEGPIGAQRPAPRPKDAMHGNLTPAPEYYLGKEDIDPRRDLRGLDSPDAYVKKNPVPDARKLPPSDSRRSSYVSDSDSAYLTMEQAQQAHNNMMMGHKQSIGSVDMLYIENDRSNRSQPDHMHSLAISESTVSMMPSLPPISSPSPFNGNKYQNGPNDPRLQQQQQRNGPPPPRGPGQEPYSPRSPLARVDPYAASAYSEEYSDDRSQVSGSYYNPNYAAQHPRDAYPPTASSPYSPNGRGGGGPYSPQPMSPAYRGNYPPYPQQHQQDSRQHPGSPSYPKSRPSPPGPGFQQDGPYQRQY
ncbi:hypothetical protein EDD21DRAFT_367910 [Dissophora ornata]|nr:hypothetical protein EDD21DRAFT_367910 [Dissophora ornata]